MRTTIRYRSSALRTPVPARVLRLASLPLAGLLGAALLGSGLLGTGLLQAQSPAVPAAAQKPTQRHARPAKARKSAPAPAVPPEPPKPNWPVNNQPAPASVTWDSHGLSIQATNSSLQQILEDVATATGAKLEGTVSEQRVFGAYGPGQARDVLIQLLQGSGYNVLMIGDQDRGAPSRIVLTARSTGGAQAPAGRAAQSSSDDDAADNEPDEPPQPPVAPPIIRPGFGPGTTMRPPQPMPPDVNHPN